MHPWGFYLVALALAGLGSLCILNTSPYTRQGGKRYERRRRFREIAVVFWVLSGVILGLGLVVEFVSRNP